MNDGGSALEALIDTEAVAYERRHAPDDLVLFERAIAPRRLARRLARAGAVSAVAAFAVVGLGQAFDHLPAPSPTAADGGIADVRDAVPAVEGFVWEPDGTVLPAPQAYAAETEGVALPGCGELDEHAATVRASDAWTTTSDQVIALGRLVPGEGAPVRMVARVFFEPADARGLVDEFTALADACAGGFGEPQEVWGELVAVDAVETTPLRLDGVVGLHVTLESERGAAELYLVARDGIAVGMTVPPGTADPGEAALAPFLDGIVG